MFYSKTSMQGHDIQDFEMALGIKCIKSTSYHLTTTHKQSLHARYLILEQIQKE